MTLRRLLLNIAVGVVLVAILFGIMAVIIDERCSRAVSLSDPGDPFVQEVKK